MPSAGSGRGEIRIHQPEILKFFVNGVEYTDHLTNYEFVEQKNNLTSFSASLVDIGDTEKLDVKRGNDIQFRYGSVLIYKCRIEKCDYQTYDFCDISGYDTVQSILKSRTVSGHPGQTGCDSDSDEGRPIYSGGISGVASTAIVAGQLSGISSLVRVGTNAYLGHVVARADFDNILSFEDGMVRNLSGVWWSSYGSSGVHTFPYTTNHFNVDKQKTSQAVAYSFYLSGDLANATETSREIDEESLATSIVFLGVGNGQNQVKSRCFHATDNWTRLSNFVSGVQTTLFNVDDSSVLPASGTVWCGLEKVIYTGKTGSTLTGITRGKLNDVDANGYTFLKGYEHSKGVAVYDTTYTEVSTDGNSKIDSLGLHKATFTDQRVIDQDALDLMATNALVDNWYLKERIKILPVDLYDCLQNIVVGSTVYILDSESGLDGNFQVVGQSLRFNEGLEELEYEVSNVRDSLTRDLQTSQQKVKVGSQYMTGSSTVFQVQSYENCDDDQPLDIRFYLPPEVIKVANAQLSFKVKNYRSYEGITNPIVGITTGSAGFSSTSYDITIATWTTWYVASSSITSNVDTDSLNICVYLNYVSGGTPPITTQWRLYDSTDGVYYPFAGGLDTGLVTENNDTSDRNFIFMQIPGNFNGHSLQLQVRGYNANATARITGTISPYFISQHTHTQQYVISGITGSDTAVVDVDIGPDGGTLNRVKTNSTGENGLDVTEWMYSGITLGGDTGNWLDIRFTPDKPTRVEANLFAKVFIHS